MSSVTVNSRGVAGAVPGQCASRYIGWGECTFAEARVTRVKCRGRCTELYLTFDSLSTVIWRQKLRDMRTHGSIYQAS